MAGPGHKGGDGDASPRIRPFLGAWAGPIPRPRASGDEGTSAGGLRPYVLTAGRVSGQDDDIGLHTQVTTSIEEPADGGGLPSEARAIVALCAEPMSIAEISGRLRLHLGVTKILVGDLRAAGYLDVHLQDTMSPHDPDTIMRVIDGLRAFT